MSRTRSGRRDVDWRLSRDFSTPFFTPAFWWTLAAIVLLVVASLLTAVEVAHTDEGDLVRFVRIGTLDEPDLLPPDVHIFTASKQPWVVLPPGTPAVPEYYDAKTLWPPESLARRAALRAATPNP